MKILGLSCSPRPKGNSVSLLNIALEGAKAEGADVELFSVAGRDIKPCDACQACAKTGVCQIKDDMQELYTKLLESDGIIFGIPVYFYGMTAQAKAVIDRTICLGASKQNLANKVGSVIVTGGSLGLVDVLKDLYFYMVTRQMIPANYVAAYPRSDLKQMEKCIQATSDLGRQMVLIARQKFQYPDSIGKSSFAFGTHTI